MKNTKPSTFPLWQTVLQLGSLAFLLVLLFLPHADAEVITTPTSIPTSIEGSRDLIPSTPDPSAELDRARQQAQERAQQEVGALLQGGQGQVPRTLQGALGREASTQVGSYAEQRAQQETQDDLAARGLPAVAAGDVSGLLNDGAVDPLTLAALTDTIQKGYADRFNAATMAGIQSAWVLGVQVPADCTSGNDDGQDLCSKLEELDQKIKDVDDQVNRVLTKAQRLKNYLSNKPVYLNTASRVPVCMGLLTPGTGVVYTPVSIAPSTAPYNSSERLVSLETIKGMFANPSSTANQTTSASSTSSDPLGAASNASDAGATTHVSGVTSRQNTYDELYGRGVSNFNQSLQGRWDLLETRTNELKDATAILVRITSALKLRPVTP